MMAKKKTKPKPKYGLEEKLLVGIMAICAVMIGASFLTHLIPTPSEQADQSLKRIAEDYYLTYLYPQLMSADKDLERAFKKYDEAGVPTIYLRQLLHYNNGQYSDADGVFKEVGCDTNRTGVRYYPKEPYGSRDYDIKYIWGCSKKAE